MEVGTQITLAIIGSGALSVLINRLFDFLQTKKKKNDAISLLLYRTIKVECKEFIELGEIDTDSLKVLMSMHEEYKRLGGNGYLNKLMEEVNKLPVKG